MTQVRKSNEEWKITEDEFILRFNELFYDPSFDDYKNEISKLRAIAWKTYSEGKKSPRTQNAGKSYKDSEFDLSVEWIKTNNDLARAREFHENSTRPNRVLLISAAHRNDHTCPGEISKSIRLLEIAKETLLKQSIDVEVLDLSRLNSEYGKKIHPCKACVSTAMPLCHWPCSCYPNHYLGQVQDWMSEIYPMWVKCDGVMIITPVYWHQSPSALKLMIDRMVCADGGNPDPTTTQGKDPELAKKLELEGWDYPRHLKGRVYSVVVHGDAMGVDDAKNVLCDWLEEIELIPAGLAGRIGRYIGYFKPYATSHDDLDKDQAIQNEVINAALALDQSISAARMGKLQSQLPELADPRPK